MVILDLFGKDGIVLDLFQNIEQENKENKLILLLKIVLVIRIKKKISEKMIV